MVGKVLGGEEWFVIHARGAVKREKFAKVSEFPATRTLQVTTVQVTSYLNVNLFLLFLVKHGRYLYGRLKTLV